MRLNICVIDIVVFYDLLFKLSIWLLHECNNNFVRNMAVLLLLKMFHTYAFVIVKHSNHFISTLSEAIVMQISFYFIHSLFLLFFYETLFKPLSEELVCFFLFLSIFRTYSWEYILRMKGHDSKCHKNIKIICRFWRKCWFSI